MKWHPRARIAAHNGLSCLVIRVKSGPVFTDKLDHATATFILDVYRYVTVQRKRKSAAQMDAYPKKLQDGKTYV